MSGLDGTCEATSLAGERNLRIRADIAMLGDAREWAAENAEAFGLPKAACFDVRLAISEAVTNAIIHGSASEEDGVELETRHQGDLLVFEVRDAGNKPRGGPSLDRVAEGGRGLALVALVMDEVLLRCSDEGGVLRFAKRRGG